MPEMASFTNITRGALRLTWQRRSLWWVAVPVGACIGIGAYATADIQRLLPVSSEGALWLSFLTSRPLFIALLFSLIATLGQAFLRGSIISSLERWIREKESSKIKPPSSSKIFRPAYVSALFEIAYWLFLFFITIVFSIPCLLAWRFNPTVLPAVLEIGFLLLLGLGIYTYFVKELSVFYALLGNIRFSLAIDLGFRLFRRQAFNTTLFFFYTALLALFFTVLIEGLARVIGISSEDSSWKTGLIHALPFGLYFIFDQALRLMFFRSIASTPKKAVAQETALKQSESPSGMASS